MVVSNVKNRATGKGVTEAATVADSDTASTTTKKAPVVSAKLSSNNDKFSAEEVLYPQNAPFTITELKRAIPAHCFERSLLRSLSHLAFDLAVISVLYYIGLSYDASKFSGNFAVDFLVWSALIFTISLFGVGVWVLAHECGHGAFSKYETVNDVIGLIFHSILLIPYFSWKFTHAKHHQGTHNLALDQVYLPDSYSKIFGKKKHIVAELLDHSAVVQILFSLLIGWPVYLWTNSWGQKFDRRANHFEPSSPLFKSSQGTKVIITDIALIIVFAAAGLLAYKTSFMYMMKVYGIPHLVVNAWLITITYLHHTDVRLPHFRDNKEWTFVKGALCTVDRDYGILNKIFHHITDTHVCHHLFSTIPFYHATEATEALKKKLGDYYLYDSTPFYVSLWDTWKKCHYVDDTGDILYWKENRKYKY